MPTTTTAKVILALIAVAPIGLLLVMFSLLFLAPNFDFSPLARTFVWVVPIAVIAACYFAWIAAKSPLPSGEKVGWVVALLLWFPITGMIFWWIVIRRLQPREAPI